jgi:iron complex outermembrane receptor protein
MRDRPKWTASVYGSYETQPLFGDATLQLRVDAFYKSSILQTNNALEEVYADRSNVSVAKIPGNWLVNGRMALRHIPIGGLDAELAVWGKNIFDNKEPVFVLFTPLATSANYGPARSYGVDLSVEF